MIRINGAFILFTSFSLIILLIYSRGWLKDARMHLFTLLRIYRAVTEARGNTMNEGLPGGEGGFVHIINAVHALHSFHSLHL